MAKQRRRAHNNSRLSAAAGAKPAEPQELASPPPAQAHVRKLQKRVRFLERVKDSALAARATAFKRKRAGKQRGATLGSLASLGDALPELLRGATPKAAAAHFLSKRGPKVVRSAARTKVVAAETTRYAAVLANPTFQADPIAAVCNHVLSQLPPPDEAMGRSGAGGAKQRAQHGQPKKQRQQRK